jgi:xylulokinase
MEPSLYLGLDSSTQSLSAVVIEVRGDARHVVLETSLDFDESLPHYGTEHGVLPGPDPAVAVSSPLMWAEALDMMMARLSKSGLDMGRLAAVSGSAQQHGSVYLNADAPRRRAALDPARPLVEQIAPMLSRAVAPIWMDSSTSAQCAEIAAAVGGQARLARHTGSRAFERFTGPQIRKLFADDPAGYDATDRIHLVSSFLASLLAGTDSPVDPGDGSGMNLMDLATGRWWPPAVEATAPGLASKLPAIAPAWTIVGPLATYWRTRYGLPPARMVVWSGDNPCSLIGVGLVREGRMAISLGTSDTVFGLMNQPRIDPGGTGHVFGAPTGDYLGLTCFRNGSLARERVRDMYGLSWTDFAGALDATPPGNGGRILLPWFEPEITPPVTRPGVRRYSLSPTDGPANVRAVLEAQQMAMALHSRWMSVKPEMIHATGGAAVNPAILQVMADVFGAEVRRVEVGNSAALGAALRALHADSIAEGRPRSWDDIVAGLARPEAAGRRFVPDASRHEIYRGLMPVYEACEAHALGRGPDPSPVLDQFRLSRRPELTGCPPPPRAE